LSRSGASSGARASSGLLWTLAAVAYLLLAWRFAFLCDDAFISFRYSRNFADGYGLRYNLTDEPPVEGYSNFLWVVGLGLVARLGVPIPVAAQVGSVACGVLLALWVAHFLRRPLEVDGRVAAAGVLFLVTTPSYVVWSTGGLATMPAALAVFAVYERLLGDPRRPRGVQAGLAALAAGLLRVEGAAFALVVLSAGGLRLLRARRVGGTPAARELRPALVAAAGVLVAGMAAFVAWRYATYGDFVSNTARAKAGLSVARIERGLDYLVSYLLVVPALPLVLVAGLAALRSAPGRALDAYLVLAADFAYAVAVGGDFMTFGRFLVVGLPFAAVLLALAAEHLRRGGPLRAPALCVLCLALSVPAGFGVHAAPRALRERFHFRWSRDYASELDVWRSQGEGARRWGAEGRELARILEPGDSLVAGAIGAIGYYSGAVIFDQYGLVTRGAPEDVIVRPRGDAGHDRFLSTASVLARRPTFHHVYSAPVGAPAHAGFAQYWRSTFHDLVELERYPASEPYLTERGLELRVLRMVRWDWAAVPFLPLAAAADGVELADAERAEEELARRLDPDDPDGAELGRRLRDVAGGGRLVWHGAAPLRHTTIVGPCHDSRDFAIHATLQAGGAPPRELPRGLVLYAVAMEGSPTLDGDAPGWRVVPPGATYGADVAGGTMLLVTLLPPRERGAGGD